MSDYHGWDGCYDESEQITYVRSHSKDFSNATELADYLAAKGLPFRQAHEIVGKLVLRCTQKGGYLQDIPLKNTKQSVL